MKDHQFRLINQSNHMILASKTYEMYFRIFFISLNNTRVMGRERTAPVALCTRSYELQLSRTLATHHSGLRPTLS